MSDARTVTEQVKAAIEEESGSLWRESAQAEIENALTLGSAEAMVLKLGAIARAGAEVSAFATAAAMPFIDPSFKQAALDQSIAGMERMIREMVERLDQGSRP